MFEKKRWFTLLGVLGVVGLLLAGTAGTVAAWRGGPPTGITPGSGITAGGSTPVGATGVGYAAAGNVSSPVFVLSDLTGLSVVEISAQLAEGATLAEVAEANGITLDAFVDALLEPRVEWLNEAVSSGAMTQEYADTILDHLRTSLESVLTTEHTSTFGTGMGTGMGAGMRPVAPRGGRMGGGMRWSTTP